MSKHTDREALKGTVLQVAAKEFRLHGIKAVKMDDIAAILKISKRTLYEVYDNKRDILFDVLVLHSGNISSHMYDFAQKAENAMDILIEYFRVQTETYATTNPAFLTDLAKYPDLMQRLHEYNEEAHKRTEQFLQKGVAEGYFLDTVNYELLTRLCHNSLREMATDGNFDRFEMRDIFNSFICVIIRGFCTQKGIQRLDQFFYDLRRSSMEDNDLLTNEKRG